MWPESFTPYGKVFRYPGISSRLPGASMVLKTPLANRNPCTLAPSVKVPTISPRLLIACAEVSVPAGLSIVVKTAAFFKKPWAPVEEVKYPTISAESLMHHAEVPNAFENGTLKVENFPSAYKKHTAPAWESPTTRPVLSIA